MRWLLARLSLAQHRANSEELALARFEKR
jgi:hypothetical protein